MKGAHRYKEILLMAFQKKLCLGQMGHLRPKMARPRNSGYPVRIVLHNESGKERHRNYINRFSEKKLIWGNLVILAQIWCVFITLDILQGFF